MSFDEDDLRQALDARSGGPTDEYRTRLRRTLASPPRGASRASWMAAIGVVVVTVLTATSVGALVAYRHSQRLGGVASSNARVATPAPAPAVGATSVQLSAPFKSTVWALVDYQALYVSTDEGGHWERRTLPDRQGVRPSIAFVNSSEGWLLAPGSPATQCEMQLADIWHTTDGAKTWVDLGARIDKTQCKDGIWFIDSSHGFVTASDPNHRPTVYRTADGGKSWSFSTIPDNPLFATGTGGFSLHVGWIKGFGNDVYLEASGSQDDASWHERDFVYTSSDGGTTWTWKQKLASPYTYMVTELRWLQLAPDVLETVNGGQAFAPYATDLKVTPPFAADFVNADHGYVVAGGAVQNTSDGGAHWTQVATPWAEAPIASPTPGAITLPIDLQLAAPSAGVVWALVAGGHLYRSTDGGANWQPRPWAPYAGGGGNPVISFVDDTRGWALFPGVPSTQCLQAGAQLWRTSDAGAHWTLVSEVADEKQSNTGLPFDQCKEFMAFVDANAGFVAGHDTTNQPVISRTMDGGSTWSRATLPDPPGFERGGGNSLTVVSIRKFGGALLAATVSNSGVQHVYRSTDGGTSWTYLVSVGIDAHLHLTFVTATRWLLLGNDGSGEETTNAGAGWHSFTCDYLSAAGVATTFVFADTSVGYGTVRGGIQRTADGGLHWTMIHTPGV